MKIMHVCELGWISYFQYFLKVLHFSIKWGEIYYLGQEYILHNNKLVQCIYITLMKVMHVWIESLGYCIVELNEMKIIYKERRYYMH
jgi:hypothetical protein